MSFGGGGNDPFSEKNRNSVLKVFMTTPIDVLCANFTEILRETIRYFADKIFVKCGFFRRHFAPVRQRAPKVCRGAYHVTYVSLSSCVPVGSDLPELFPKR